MRRDDARVSQDLLHSHQAPPRSWSPRVRDGPQHCRPCRLETRWFRDARCGEGKVLTLHETCPRLRATVEERWPTGPHEGADAGAQGRLPTPRPRERVPKTREEARAL